MNNGIREEGISELVELSEIYSPSKRQRISNGNEHKKYYSNDSISYIVNGYLRKSFTDGRQKILNNVVEDYMDLSSEEECSINQARSTDMNNDLDTNGCNFQLGNTFSSFQLINEEKQLVLDMNY